MSENNQKLIFSKNLNKYLAMYQKQQKEVADAIGVIPTTFNTWCTGQSLPRMGKVQALADYFGILKSDLIEDKTQIASLDRNNSSELNSDFFAEKVVGKSMEPRIYNGDIVIVHTQNDIENGDIAVVKIKGERTTKKIIKQNNGFLLVGLNTAAYTPEFYKSEDVEILGRVVEVRGKMDGWNK